MFLMPFCNSGPSLYSQQVTLYYNASADASIFFTFHSPLYKGCCGREGKTAAAHPRMERRQAARTRRKPFFQAALRLFFLFPKPSGQKHQRRFFSGKAADILALCFHALLKCARKLQKQQIVIIKQIFLFPDLLSSEIEG